MNNHRIKKCSACSCALRGRQTKFCSIKCKNSVHQNYSTQRRRAVERRDRLLSLRGGACSKCGYARCTAALEFHHINPATKLFKLDARSCSNRTWRSLLIEAEKCALLCANCHREHHST